MTLEIGHLSTSKNFFFLRIQSIPFTVVIRTNGYVNVNVYELLKIGPYELL